MAQLKLFDFSGYGEAKLVEIPVSLCVPHELNPRFQDNEELIDRIAEQIQENGFKPEHAILVRPKNSQFQIISGHHRIKAAKKVNLENILAWVSEGMSDERAHSLLLLENDQSELSPLEKGKHAFDHVKQFDSKGGRGKIGGLSEYARIHKLSQPLVSQWVSAYQVFEKTYNGVIGFEKISHKVLYEISQSPSAAWQYLVEFALSEEWTIAETAEVVKKIDGMEALADYSYSLPTIYAEALKHRGKKYQLFQNILKRILHWQEILPENITLYQWTDTQEEREENNQLYRRQVSQSFQFNAKQEFIDAVKSRAPRDTEKIDEITSSVSNTIKECSIGGTERWIPLRSQAEIEKLRHIEAAQAWVSYVDSRLLCADSMDTISDSSIDLIIADPPYNINTSNKVTKKKGEIVSFDFLPWDISDKTDYLQFLQSTFAETKRVLKESGSFYFFLDRAMVSYAWDIIASLGMLPKNILVWRKTNPVPHARKNNYLSATEFIVFGVKTEKYQFNFFEDNEMHNIITSPICSGAERTEHPTQKPLTVVEHLIKVSSKEKDLVLDPFCGSGTTGVAAIKLNRDFMLIDIDPNAIKISKERLLACRKI